MSMHRIEQFEVRDPIHKRIAFNGFERSLIDHPFVQRLRFISQLGFLQTYVYPGGMHDRFTHALGAMHVAGRLFGQLEKSSDVLSSRLSGDEINALRLRVRVAGLLHDIGHGPFSHASETVFPQWNELPLNREWWKRGESRQAKHEDYTVLLVQTMAAEGRFSEGFAQDVASLIHGGVQPSTFFDVLEQKAPRIHAIMKSLISGEVDCDRMDYLLRDSYYCGVAYGQYDLDWLISARSLVEHQGEIKLVISENGVRAFEDMLLARYHMIDQVYFHKTKAGFTHYLEQAIGQKEIDLKIPSDPYAYADLRDGAVIEQLFVAAQSGQAYWSHHLMHRIPPRRIQRFQDASSEDTQSLENLKSFCEDHNIAWFTHAVKGELSHLREGMGASSRIYVEKKTAGATEYVPIFAYSDLLQKYNEKIQFTDFFIHRESVDAFERFREDVQ